MGVKKIIVVKFIEGLDVEPIEQGSIETTAYKQYASEAAFVADKGSAASNGDCFFDTTADQVKLYHGSWIPLIDELVHSSLTLANGNSLSPNLKKRNQTFLVSGASGACTLSNSPFGGSAPKNGSVFCVIGMDDTKTVTLNYSDTDYGLLMNAPLRTLGKGQTVVFKWVQSILRYVDIGANF